MLLRFLAGLSPTELSNALLVQLSNMDLKRKGIPWLFEAKICVSNTHVKVNYEQIVERINPFYSYMLGSVIAKSINCHWEVWITGLPENIQMFVSGISTVNFRSGLTLNVIPFESNVCLQYLFISELCHAPITIECLNIASGYKVVNFPQYSYCA